MSRPVSPKKNGVPDGFALGRQMTVEFYDCDPRKLADDVLMEKVFLEATHESGATVVDSRFHRFTPQGVSGVVIISESHFAVHAWPEHEYAAVDLFTCGDSVDFDKAIKVIAAGMGCREWIVSSLVNRGIVGNNGVERIVQAVENRECFAFQLSWKKRYEQTRARAMSCAFDFCECGKLDFSDPAAPEKFIRALTQAAGFRCGGAFRPEYDGPAWRDFTQPLESGRISGSLSQADRTVYLDIFTKGYFDPRRTAELAVELLGGAYYRMQPQVRN